MCAWATDIEQGTKQTSAVFPGELYAQASLKKASENLRAPSHNLECLFPSPSYRVSAKMQAKAVVCLVSVQPAGCHVVVARRLRWHSGIVVLAFGNMKVESILRF